MVLAAFDEQIRRRTESDLPNGHIEHHGGVVRSMPAGDGWAGVTWSDLNQGSADTVIATQISEFAARSRPWEWKYYSYDQPGDLPERLLAAEFTRQPVEALLVAELSDLALDVPPPAGVSLRTVLDQHDAEQYAAVHEDVFGGNHARLGAQVLGGLSHQPSTVEAVVAFAHRTPIAGGRVEFQLGTDFATRAEPTDVALQHQSGISRSTRRATPHLTVANSDSRTEGERCPSIGRGKPPTIRKIGRRLKARMHCRWGSWGGRVARLVLIGLTCRPRLSPLRSDPSGIRYAAWHGRLSPGWLLKPGR